LEWLVFVCFGPLSPVPYFMCALLSQATVATSSYPRYTAQELYHQRCTDFVSSSTVNQQPRAEIPPLQLSSLQITAVSAPPEKPPSNEQNNSTSLDWKKSNVGTSSIADDDDVDDGGYKDDEEDAGSISSSSPLKRSHLAMDTPANQDEYTDTHQERRLVLDLSKVSHHDHPKDTSERTFPRKKQKIPSTLYPSSLSSLSYLPQKLLANGTKSADKNSFIGDDEKLSGKSGSPASTLSISSEESSLMKDPTSTSVTSFNEYKWSTLYHRNTLKSKEIKLQKLFKLIDMYSIPVFAFAAVASTSSSSSSSSSVDSIGGDEATPDKIMEVSNPSFTSESCAVTALSSDEGKETALIAGLMKGLNPKQAQAKLLKWLEELEQLDL
jgi:hypothetical protein